MYSSSDFERLFIRYKAEAMPQGESIQDFCLRNKVPYNLFHKWYKDTRHQIVPVQVEGQPETEANLPKEVSSSPTPERKENTEPCPVRMMIDIRMTNGIRIQQRNLTYRNLKRLIDLMSCSNEITYLNDDCYDIDNSIAGRFIRLLAGEHKNSLSFVSSPWQILSSLSYAAVNMPNERAVCSGISQEILPQNCQREKEL